MIRVAAAVTGALLLAAAAPPGAAAGTMQELLRQQGAAERTACGTVRRALDEGFPAGDVVHTAIGIGFGACEVLRCALEAGAPLAPVLEAGAGTGTPPEVLARCAVEAGVAPAEVAALLNDLSTDPSYCYFAPELGGGPPVTPPYGDPDRRYASPEFSPFTP